MVEHTVKAFDDEIGALRGLIAEMGGLAEVGIAQSVEALVKRDTDLAAEAVRAVCLATTTEITVVVGFGIQCQVFPTGHGAHQRRYAHAVAGGFIGGGFCRL